MACVALDKVGGVLGYAAVPRVGLGPTAPPLCRYAEYTTDLILETWQVFSRRTPICSLPMRLVCAA